MPRGRFEEGPLEQTWKSYRGTGVSAKKGEDTLVLREGVGFERGNFAVVKLYNHNGDTKDSPMKVFDIIHSQDFDVAEKLFRKICKKHGFRTDRKTIVFRVNS